MIPPLLVADSELWVPCSSDPYSTLYVFQKRGRNWDLALTTEADYLPGRNYSDAGMEYVVSSQDQNGKWFLGVASVFPNCRNTGLDDKREVQFKILRPGPSPDSPVVLLNRRLPIYDKFKTPFNVTADEDRFSITVGKERRLDGELGVSIFRFDVQQNQVSRVAPFALQPEDFLDEWVRADWSEVAPWTNTAKGADLEEWRAKLKNLAYDSAELEFVQPCPKQERYESSWLLGLWIDQQQNRNIADQRFFISVSQRMGAYFVEGIGKTRPTGCPGDTRPKITDPDTELPWW